MAMNNGGPAFPTFARNPNCQGMSQRTLIAAFAQAGWVKALYYESARSETAQEAVTKRAAELGRASADALLAELQRTDPPDAT